MRIQVYVEGPSEQAVLPIVFGHALGQGRAITVFPLRGSRFLGEIGERAAAILARNPDEHVFACPDLAPKDAYENTPWAYTDYTGLRDALRRQVRRELEARLSPRKLDSAAERFHPHPFRHDFEVLMLALPEHLKRYLRAETDITKHYNARFPEDQDFLRYPKRVVASLFRQHLRRAYNPPKDGQRFFQRVTPDDVRGIELSCPCFREFLAVLRALVSPADS
jgi:hypothetical protein